MNNPQLPSVVSIKTSELRPSHVPPQVSDFVNPNQWLEVCQAVSRASDQSMLFSCGGEVLCCCVTGFFLIFCCHPCIYMAVNNWLIEEEMARLNRSHFNGSPVYGFVNDCVTINLSYVIPMSVSVVDRNPNPVYVNQPKETFSTAENESSALPVAEAVSPSNTGERQRVFYITITTDMPPGSTTTVTSPSGQPVQVQIPPQAVPGQQIAVSY